MNFTLVDKNLLIPEISTSNNFFDIITQFYKRVYQRNLNYCSNVYIVIYNNFKYESNIQFENNIFYEITDNSKRILDINLKNIFIETNNIQKVFNEEPIKEVKKMEIIS